MWTNKTGAPVCVDNDGNVVPCDSPKAAFQAAGPDTKLTAEEMKQYKGLPEGDDNAPPVDQGPGDEQPEGPKPTDPDYPGGLKIEKDQAPVKQIGSAPSNKMEQAPATKDKGK